MAASNTVEATLVSKFQDGVSRGVEHTENVMSQAFASMRNGGAVLSSFMSGVWGSVVGGLESWRQRLQKASEESASQFGKIGLAGAAMAAAAVVGFAKMAQAALNFVFELAKSSSAAFEAKIAFESMAGGAAKADALLRQLKQATEGQVSGTVLMQNANRVMQSHVQISNDLYAKLIDNVFRLAKSSGVDATQAINTLTDGLIRGNARGLQSIGIHLSLRDAVSAMAEAEGGSAARLADPAKMRAFYNELLKQTNQAIGELGPGYLTVEDILKQSQNTWKGLLESFGIAINRSGMLQEMMKRASEAMLGFGAGEEAKKTTLAVNDFLLALSRGLASAAEVLGVFLTVWNLVWGTVKLVINGAGTIITGVLAGIAMGWQLLFDLLGKLPGAAGKMFRGVAEAARPTTEFLKELTKEFAKGVASSYDGFDGARQKLNAFAAATRQLAGEMEKYKGVVLEGTAGTGQHGAAAGEAAGQQKKLNEQYQKYLELRKELMGRSGNQEGAALAQLFADWGKIDQELTAKGAAWDARRNELKMKALSAYDAKVREIEVKRAEELGQLGEEGQRIFDEMMKHRTDSYMTMDQLNEAIGVNEIKREQYWNELQAKWAKEREDKRQQEVNGALAAANAIQRTIELASQGKISPQVGQDALSRLPQTIALLKTKLDELRSKPILTEQQIDDLTRLQTKLDQLNRLNWTPFRHALQTMRQDISQFAQTATESFATFFANLVSGQEGSGKKLLAAFIGMIGQMLVHVGVILVQTGIAEIALAQTLVGKLMGASVGAGLKAIAIGALIAAAGGIMEGMASNLAQTSSAGGAASQTGTQQAAAAPSQAQVINVAAPRGPQNPGEASGAAGQEPVQVHLKIDAEEGFVVRQVERNVRNNGRLRVVIQNA
jgi:hypothetical protein